MKMLAIDPGNEQSAYVVYDTETKLPVQFGILDNETLKAGLPRLTATVDMFAVEMIASYGMAVGKTVFDTCVWIGRFIERSQIGCTLIYRKEVCLHLCNSPRANDSNIRASIIDLYGGSKQKAVGTKNNPGPLYGFRKDIWAAMGVALTAADKMKGVK